MEANERRAGSRPTGSDEAFPGAAQLPRPWRRVGESGRRRRPRRAAGPDRRARWGIGLRQDDARLPRPEALRADRGAEPGGWHEHRRAVTRRAAKVETERPDGLPGSPRLSRSAADRAERDPRAVANAPCDR